MDTIIDMLVQLPPLLMTMSFDKYLTAIIANNWITLTSFIGFLKGLAALSDNNTDDKIVTFLENLVGSRGRKVPSYKTEDLIVKPPKAEPKK